MSPLITTLSLERPDGQFEELMVDGARSVNRVTGIVGMTTRERVRPRPGRHGVLNTSRYRDADPIVIEGLFRGATADDAWTQYNAVARVAAAATAVDRRLRWSGGTVLELVETHVRLVSMQPPLEAGPDIIRYQLTLRASDPRSYAQTESLAMGDPLSASGGGKTYPFTYPRGYTPAGGGAADFTVGGTDETPPILRVYGFCTAPTLRLDDEQDIVLAGEVDAGRYIDVDVDKREVRLDDGSVVNGLFDYENSTWFELAPGPHTLQMFASSFDATAHVEVIWRDAYA